jgi:alanine dehydrogenase
MLIGTVKEIKNQEYRVGLTPSCVSNYVNHGHQVIVEQGCGLGSYFTDEEYLQAGAKLVSTAKEVWEQVDMIVKVKEPLASEYGFFRKDLLIYTYLHLAADEHLTKALLASGCNSVAYETIEDYHGLPCLRPMSEIAGRLSVQEGAKYLEKPYGGRGVLLGGVPGVEKGNVVVIGAGSVGVNAARMAYGLGANVSILDINQRRLNEVDDLFEGKISTLYSNQYNLENALRSADLIIGAVLIPGYTAPKVIRKEHLSLMKPGAVLVDVAIDQGGCFETSHVTTHDQPIYIIDGVVHYCVGNMPGCVARTSTMALTNTTLKYGLMLADYGLETALTKDSGLMKGLNTYQGQCTCEGVAKAFSLEYHHYQ